MSSFKKKRADLRRRLQDQRRRFSQRERALESDLRSLTRERGFAGLLEPRETFPRSLTMRLLTNRQNFVVLAVAELIPILLRHFLKNAEPPRQLEER